MDRQSGYKLKPLIQTQLHNLLVISPVSFREMMNLYKKTSLIITDSGGIQEEAAYLGIPIIIFRTKTERVEGICKGIAKYMDDCNSDLHFAHQRIKPAPDQEVQYYLRGWVCCQAYCGPPPGCT